MSRTEMIKKAIEIAESDMMNMGISKEEIITEAHKLTDAELKEFIEGN